MHKNIEKKKYPDNLLSQSRLNLQHTPFEEQLSHHTGTKGYLN